MTGVGFPAKISFINRCKDENKDMWTDSPSIIEPTERERPCVTAFFTTTGEPSLSVYLSFFPSSFLVPSYLFIWNKRMRWKVNSLYPILISRAFLFHPTECLMWPLAQHTHTHFPNKQRAVTGPPPDILFRKFWKQTNIWSANSSHEGSFPLCLCHTIYLLKECVLNAFTSFCSWCYFIHFY